MKINVSIVAILISICLQGCTSKYYSGFTVGQFGDGHIVEYEELRSLQSGSLSTVWYRGSDEDFHYFQHYVKTSTKYRVKKEEVEIEEEFPRGTKKPIHLGRLEHEIEALR